MKEKELLSQILKTLDKIETTLTDIKANTTPPPKEEPMLLNEEWRDGDGWVKYYANSTLCPTCGINFQGPTGYVCTRQECPTYSRSNGHYYTISSIPSSTGQITKVKIT